MPTAASPSCSTSIATSAPRVAIPDEGRSEVIANTQVELVDRAEYPSFKENT